MRQGSCKPFVARCKMIGSIFYTYLQQLSSIVAIKFEIHTNVRSVVVRVRGPCSLRFYWWEISIAIASESTRWGTTEDPGKSENCAI